MSFKPPKTSFSAAWRLSFRYVSRLSRRQASSHAPETDKSRILEKPARFNPPSHGSRRVKPRSYPGPRLSDAEIQAQKTKRYPNTMPPEGTFMYYFLTNRKLHLWITLSTLTTLAVYASATSFLHTTEFRDQLPSGTDFLSHPFSSTSQFLQVYKIHTEHESRKVSEKRRKKAEDADKRKEFLRKHGVEPGFLTGTWMDKFGTVDQEEATSGLDAGRSNQDEQAPISAIDVIAKEEGDSLAAPNNDTKAEQAPRKKPKMWLGIW